MAEDEGDDQWHRWEDRIKSLALLAIGLVGLVNELFVRGEPRVTALAFLGGVLGLPFVIDGARRGGRR